ncbi:UNVERIFIED_CONTAM: hypothetical protein HDU68_000055 [Siphonaria sp. JEL0065]|nr:hypothetical protein HDU68_000055 [Siphonaria sp. JEL0065]
MCAHQFSQHDVFISYRVFCDKYFTAALADAISLAGLHPYLDANCLVAGMGWKEGFLQGLDHSKLIVLTVSVECLKSLKASNDNVFLEWELAFKREQEGRAVVVPLFIEDEGTSLVLPELNTFPDELHENHESPREISLRSLVARIYQRQGILTTVIRNGESVTIDKNAIAQILRIGQQLRQAKALIGFQPTLSSGETKDLEIFLDMTKDPVVLFRNPTELQDVIAVDVIDWVADVSSRVVMIPSGVVDVSGLDSVIQITLTRRNFFAGHLGGSVASSPSEFLFKLVFDLAVSFPTYGQTVLAVIRSLPDGWKSFEVAHLFQTLVLSLLGSVPMDGPLVLLVTGSFEDPFTNIFSLLKLLPRSFKFVFIGNQHGTLVGMFDTYLVSVYELEEATSAKNVKIDNSINVQKVITTTTSTTVAINESRYAFSHGLDPEFVICYSSPKDKILAFELAEALSLGSSHRIFVQPTVSELASLMGTVMVLLLFSDDGVIQFSDASNVFLDQIQRLSSNSHPVPMLVEYNGTPFNIGSLFSYQYETPEKRESIVNLFKIQGIKLSASDVTRSVASIFQTQKQVLGLAISGNIDPSKQPLTAEEDSSLVDFLSPVVELLGAERSRVLRQYIPGTRTWLIDEMMDFIDLSSDRLLWLNAPAGTGKSVVSALLADRLQKSNTLGAAFFFRHDNHVLRSALTLVTSVAYSLSHWSPSYGRRLLSILRSGDVDFRAAPSFLFDKLLTEPLNELAEMNIIQSPIVLIIDALDECSELSARRDLLGLFAHKIKKLPTFVKVVVTSRPEHDIVAAFNASGLPQHQIVPSEGNNKKDVEMVARVRLTEMGVAEDILESLVSVLLEKSGGLFIWIVMALEALKTTSKTLADVEALPLGLNSMYESTFTQIFHRRTSPILSAVIQVIGVSQEPLSCAQITEFVVADEKKVKSSIDRLKSVLSEDSGRFSFVHKSVSDYLTSVECGDTRFKLDIAAVHRKLFLRLMEVMNELRENMAGLDLAAGKPSWPSSLLSPSLAYSVTHWPKHFTSSIISSSSETDGLIMVLHAFCANKLLFYLEAILLLKKLSDLIKIIQSVTSCVDEFCSRESDSGDFIKAILIDLKFVAFNFRSQLEFNPLQVYNHALISVPQNTLYYKTYSHFAPAEFVFRAGLEWGPLSIEKTVRCVRQIDRNLIITGSMSGEIQFFDIHTGECLQTIGTVGSVTSIALTSDKKRVMIGSSNIEIRVLETWEWIATLVGYSDEITSLVLLSCDKLLISASLDKTIRVWDIESGRAIQLLTEHSEDVMALCVSSDEKVLISGSHDCTVKVWSLELAAAGKVSLIQSLDLGIGRIRCVAFSPVDNSIILAGSNNKLAQTRSLKTGEAITTFSGFFRWVYSLTFSPDGKYVIFGGSEEIKIWNIETQCIMTIEDKFRGVRNVMFLGQTGISLQFVSTCATKIRFWDVKLDGDNPFDKRFKGYVSDLSLDGKLAVLKGGYGQGPEFKVLSRESGGGWDVKTFLGHTGGDDTTTTTVISTDCRFVASVTGKIIRVWNVSTGECLQTFEEVDHTNALVFYKDILISSPQDNTIKIWSVNSKTCVETLYGHDESVKFLVVSEDGQTLLSAGRRSARIWRLQDMKCISVVHLPNQIFSQITNIDLSLDGKTLVIESNDVRLSSVDVHLWSVESGLCLQTFHKNEYPFLVAQNNLCVSAKTDFFWWSSGWLRNSKG